MNDGIRLIILILTDFDSDTICKRLAG